MTAFTALRRPMRRYLASPVRIHWPSAVLDLLVVAIAVALAALVVDAPMSGDYGQWLMVSRYYAGEDVPDYRDVFAVAPLVPIVLAGLRLVLHDYFEALNALRVIVAAGFVAGFYTVAGVAFRSRLAGLLAVLFALLSTTRFLELFAFGGLLQLTSLALMMGSLACIAQTGRPGDRESFWWNTAGVMAALAVFAHAGSVVLVAPVAAACALVTIAARWRDHSTAQWARLLAGPVLLGALALVYWVVILVPTNEGYGSNPASAGYRGADRLIENLTSSRITVGAIAFGSCSLAIGALRELHVRTPRGFCLVATWAAVTWSIFGLAVLADAATDYPRFATPLLAPLIAGTAGGAWLCIEWLARRDSGTLREWSQPVPAALLVSVILLVLLGPGQRDSFEQRTSGYRISDRSAMETFAGWIDRNLPEGESVMVLGARDGKWIEGLTGESAVFTNEIRYSFRAHEWERSLAADAMIRSTGGLSNGFVQAKFISAGSARGVSVPRSPVFGFNHDGEWLDLLLASDVNSRVIADDLGGTVFATLAALEPVGMETQETTGTVTVTAVFAGMRRGMPIVWVRTVTADRDSHVLNLTDEVQTPASIREIQVDLKSFSGTSMETVTNGRDTATIRFGRRGERFPRLSMTVDAAQSRIEQAGDDIRAVAAAHRLSLNFEIRTASSAISEMQVLEPSQLARDYNVGAAVLREGPAFESRRQRLAVLGLCETLRRGDYVLLTRTCMEANANSIPYISGDGP